MDSDLRGLIFDIQGYSVHDGPGCRTLVFMKGCPLRCEWCSNPEGMRHAPDILFRNTKCTHRTNNCNRCIEACPHQAIQPDPDWRNEDDAQLLLDRRLCSQCATQDCLRVCYFEGLSSCGEWKTVDDLMHVFDRNRHYWQPNGGASFSGGEPLMQSSFIQAVLEACRQEKIHTAVETTAYINSAVFLRLMQLVDFAFIDIKHVDSTYHKAKTGVGNELILQNIAALAASQWPGRLVLRMPVIRGYNDGVENINAIADFMQKIGLVEINLLPFHRLGDSKWTQLGQEYAYHNDQAYPEEHLFQLQDIFLSRRIACYLGSETPF